MKRNHRCNILLAIHLIFASTLGCGNTLDQQRSIFLQAQKQLQQGNTADFLALSSSIQDYPLHPYLHYQWLKNNLQKTAQIAAFLSTHKDSYYAGALRSQWLDYLAKQERWHEFKQHYQATGNVARECQFYWAHYKLGDKQLALVGAKRLWMTGNSRPKSCDGLFFALIMSPAFANDLPWQRFELALAKDNIGLAKYLRGLLGKAEQPNADVWIRVHNNPAIAQDRDFWQSNDPQMGRLFAHSISQMAKTDLDSALTAWDGRNGALAIDPQIEQQIDRKLALALAYKRDNRAYSRLSQLPANDGTVKEWAIRAALQEQNWQHVMQALARLTAQEQQTPKWQYWYARAQEATGNKEIAQLSYAKVADDRSFYGFIAAERINKPYHIAGAPAPYTETELDSLAATPDFAVIREFNFFNLTTEARRQWFFVLNKLSQRQLMLAAKLAQHWQWDQLAIITLAKAGYWDDIALRFPIQYASQINNNASRLGIDPAIIFALIRQESMLDSHALSPAGARGLMQIMPATGQYIASKLGEPWQSERHLFNPDLNIRYGSTYYKQLLDRFSGHFALATAAYNAGPNRITKWLPTDKPAPADIWIETIPYKETRQYVTRVLSYALIYQFRTQKNALTLKNLLGDVKSTKN